MQATVLLQKNLENAKASLEVLVADLQFLRDQVTITQVSFGHIYQNPFLTKSILETTFNTLKNGELGCL